ncbi:MAG: carboxypeptidase regulatory-like domain-containing protein [Acidobacteriaceae bacterium]
MNHPVHLAHKFRFAVLMLALALFIGARQAQAQNIYAAIHGTVTDATGAVVPGASVTVLNTSTGVSAHDTTDSHGYYIFPELQVGGPYTVTVKMRGFQASKSVGIQLHVNDNLNIGPILKPGSVNQVVEVNANKIQVQTSDTQLQTTLTSSQIEAMPMLGFDADILQKLTPGTVESSDRFGSYSANGSQTQENSYLLDGADNNDAPLQTQGLTVNPDALGEVTFVTSTLDPQYSRNSGAIVNEVLKSGTNQFHGDGFEFYRDTFMNLGGYFAAPGQRPVFHQNVYGGTLGGPMIKDKLFFFIAYQGIRNRTAVATLTNVPDAAQLGSTDGIANLTNDANVYTSTADRASETNAAGLSSNPIPVAISTPNGTCPKGTPWNVCFAPNAAGQTNVQILTSSFNPLAANLVNKYVPAPNYDAGAGAGNTLYNFNALSTNGSDQGIIRIDSHITPKDWLWASSIFQSNPNFSELPFDGADLPGWAEINASHFKIFSSAWTHTFNASAVNTLRAGYYRFNYAAVEPQTAEQPSSYGFSGINPQDPGAASMPYIGVSGYFNLGFSPDGPQPRLDINQDFADNLTKILGNHNLMFGAEVEEFTVDNPFYANNNGSYSYNGTGNYTSGDPLLDYLVGIPTTFEQSSGSQIDARSWDIYGFAQDDWKVSDSLTLNYGIGYEILPPFANLQFGGEAIICWVPGAQSKVFPNASTSNLYPGDPGCNNQGGATTKYDHFAPRLGFDWSPNQELGWLTGPAGSHMLAIRGGFGVYYNRDSEEAQLQNLDDPPFGTSVYGAADLSNGSPSFADPYIDVYSGRQAPSPFPYSFPTASTATSITAAQFASYVPYDLSTISSKYDVPYAYNFNLNIQRQIPGDQVVTIGYVGSLGRKLIRAYEADQITPAGHAAAFAACTAYEANPNSSAAAACANGPSNVNPVNDPSWYIDTTGNFFSVGRVHTDGISNYNSLQIQLVKNETHGLYYDLAYTYSHSLDNGSGFESSGFGNSYDITGTNWVPGFQNLSYGNSEYDARQRFSAAYGYVIPLFQDMKQNRIVNEFLGGWNITGITALQSGNPVSIGETGTNNSLYCDSPYDYYSCPDTPNADTFNIPLKNPRSSSEHYWFNPAHFSPEPLGTFGNVKRNFMRGPGFNYTDLSLFKNFPLGGPGSPRVLQLRLEAYNAFNHPNFAPPVGNLSDGAQFGTIQSVIEPPADGGAGDPQPGRAVQIAGRIYF